MPVPVVMLRLYFPCHERRPFTVLLDPETYKIFPDAEKRRGTVGESFSPTLMGTPIVVGDGEPVSPTPPPNGGSSGSPDNYAGRPQGGDAGAGDKATTLYNLKTKLADTRAALAEASAQHAALMDELAGSDAEQAGIKTSLRGTFETVWGPAHWRQTTWQPDVPQIEHLLFAVTENGVAARRPLFERLTELAATWGSLRQERRHVGAMVKSLERQAKQLAREIERLTKPKRKAA